MLLVELVELVERVERVELVELVERVELSGRPVAAGGIPTPDPAGPGARHDTAYGAVNCEGWVVRVVRQGPEHRRRCHRAACVHAFHGRAGQRAERRSGPTRTVPTR